MSRKELRKRFSLATLLWFVGLSLGGLFVLARPTFAQEGSSSTATASIISALKTASGACPGLTPCPAEGAAEGLETADDKLLKPALQTALLSVLLNVVQFALDRLAYEAAVAIASGGEGQSELFYSDTPSESWKKFGLDIAGEAIGNLNDVTSAALETDFNLCSPKNDLVRLNIQLGIKQAYQPQKPKCDWNDISSNWEGFVTTTLQTATHPGEAVTAAFAKGLRPGQNELSAAVGLNIKVRGQVLEAKSQQFAQQINSDGFKDLTQIVTGKVETPSSVLERQFNDQLQASKEKGVDFNMQAVINSPQLIGQMFLQVAGVFVNTLLSTLFNRVYNGLFDPQPTPNPFDVELISLGGRDSAASRFANFISANPVTINDYNAMSEFVTCPSGGVSIRNINNCVMDANFAAATARGSSGTPITIQDAIDEGLLQGNWPLIPATEQDKNQDPFCYTYGYCYGNLVKLRKARILPVGWEIAAARNAGGKATLQEIVDGFDDCNDQGTISPSDSSKWCHLIDPNWILKYPDTQCKAYVNGEILISSIAAGRSGECVDTPSCISQDANGNCTGGYGYCVMEKNVWQFRGDECPAEFAGCLSFENTFDGDAKSLLLDTVDFSVCTAQNAGCEWYRTNKYFDNKGTTDPADDGYSWLPGGETFLTAPHADDVRFEGSSRTNYTYDTNANGTADGSYSTYSYEDRLYLNNNVQVCSASEAGCTKVFDAKETTLNLVGNPSFEEDVDGDKVPDGWNLTGLSGYTTTGGSYFGTDAISLASSASTRISRENISLSPGSFYTFSFYARGKGSNATGNAKLTFVDEDGSTVDFAGSSFDEGEDCVRTSANAYEIAFTTDLSAWTRYECTFTALAEPIYGTIQFDRGTGEVRVDGIQLERGESATTFTTGYSASSATPSYLKIAPDYLGCDGSENDPKECDAYVQMCTAQDVGCNLYTPNDGDPSVPAIASGLDQCPNECVGYSTYKQEGTLYDNEEFPLYFIADTATQCSAEQVGCDGFTNLDTVANGGEAEEYYTSLRACVKEDQADGRAATFFTWEGSDVSGYQLVTWRFLKSTRTTSVDYSEASGVTDTQPSLAPCVSWESVEGADGSVSVECRDEALSARAALDADNGCNELSDIFNNPDCREFYDANGNIHYRRVSQTVLVDNACHPYRKTVATEGDCVASKGLWDAAAGSCFYTGLAEESASCPEVADGCRAYTGGSGRNTTTVLSETFEGGDYANFMRFGNASVTLSNESVASSGHSLRVTGNGSNSGVATLQAFANTARNACATEGGCAGSSVSGYDGSCTVQNGKVSCGALTQKLVPGQTLTLEFWAKGSGNMSASIVDEGGQGTVHSLGSVALEGGWQVYTLGPVDTSASGWSSFSNNSVLRFQTSNNVTFYLDNIRLKQTGETVTLIKNSWQTPASCDTAPSGVSAPQYFLGCEEYQDQNGDEGSYYQFSNLCSEQVVGCGAFFDTQNSASPTGAAYNVRCMYDTDGDVLDGETASTNTACSVGGDTVCTISTGREYCLFDATTGLANPLPDNVVLGPEAVVVENDRPVYVVNNGTGSCSAESMGCEEVGVPTYSQDKSQVTSFTSAYYLNLPDTYKDILCDNNALFCEEWSSTQDGNFYFKDPGTKMCEFKTNVTINTVEYSGWFQKGTDRPCDATFLEGGASYGIWRNGDSEYDGWAGSCPSSEDLCTAFVDPTDTGGGISPQGVSYTFKDNELLSEDLLQDSQRCDGQVSQKEGCALFDSHNNSELTYSASPSYIVSTRADYFFGDAPLSLQDPIDCDAGNGTIDPPGAAAEVDVCEMRCKYTLPTGVSLKTGGTYQSGTTSYAGACATSDDCSVLSGTDAQDYQGACVNAVDEAGANARFRNDTNTILKVNRDRECAAWLEPKTVKPTWDARVSKYVSISSNLQFCTGEGCSTTEQDAIVLDDITYANRDISWGGVDYSGYSIPDQLPVISYSQANINPTKVCQRNPIFGGDSYQRNALGEFVPCSNAGIDCAENYSCVDFDEELRLAHVAGTCDQDALGGLGASCVVGHCENSGNACSTNSECDANEDCVVGYCQNVSTTVCTSSTQCGGAFPVCDTTQGVCVDALAADGDACITKADCGSASTFTCTPTALSKTGSCYNDQCLTNVNGQPFTRDSDTESACRGYPESTSPFPTSVVETWSELVEDASGAVKPQPLTSLTSIERDVVPQTLKYGFQGVDTCAPADVDGNGTFEVSDACLCSYDKADYGNGSARRYYPLGTNTGDILTGVCLGGAKAGLECSSDKECGSEDAASAGTCSLLSRKDSIFGWTGFCLEKDTSIQINGSPDPTDRACLTWLPVDQIEGATDLYGKDISAGYSAGDTYYCAEVETAYDLKTTGVACAESYEINGCEDGSSERLLESFEGGDCVGAVSCPDGYFALMGGCGDFEYKPEGVAQCKGKGAKDDDCPFVCIPKNSFKTETDTGQIDDACLNPSEVFSGDVDAVYTPDDFANNQKGDWVNENTKTYIIADPAKFGIALDYYEDCTVRGIVDSLPKWIGPYDTISELPTEEPGYKGYRNLSYNIHAYPACTSVVQVAQTDGVNAAWTNRLWTALPGGPWTIADAVSSLFRYKSTTLLAPFGRAEDLGSKNTDRDPFPHQVVMCVEDKQKTGLEQMKLPPVDPGAACGGDYTINSTIGDEARSYLSIALNKSGGLEINEDFCANNDCTCSPSEYLADCNGNPTCAGGTCAGGPNDGNSCNSIEDCAPNSCLSDTTCFRQGGSESCVTTQRCGVSEIEYTTSTTEQPVSATNRLRQIFAHGLNLFRFEDGYDSLTLPTFDTANENTTQQGGFKSEPESASPSVDAWKWDVRAEGDGVEKPSAPVVHALGECFGTQCREQMGDSAVSVNGVSSGTISGDRNVPVNVNFYAYANPNQMPIKNIIVDWGDGDVTGSDQKPWPTTSQTGSTSDNNFYKNHRGLLATSETESYCKGDNATNWGETSQACNASYISFKTDYACTQRLVDALANRECLDGDDNDGYPNNSPCLGNGEIGTEGACVFRPRVHVKDNWGWCTGVCPGGADETPGCFGDLECNVDDCPGGGIGNCGVNDADPWVYFDGYVEVTL